MTDFTTGREFGQGVASWFGLDADKVHAVCLSNPTNDALTVTITIEVGAEDIVGIGNRMRELAKASGGIVLVDEYPGWEFVTGDGLGRMSNRAVSMQYLQRQRDGTIPLEMSGQQFTNMLKSEKEIRRKHE